MRGLVAAWWVAAVWVTWNVDAAGNQARVTMKVEAGGGALVNPTLVVHGYTATTEPTVQVDGATLVADADYFLTLDTKALRAWVTLRRSVDGTHTVEIK